MTAPSREPAVQPASNDVLAGSISWDDIERLVNEVTIWARDCESSPAFYEFVLRRLVESVGAAGGAVWACTSDGSLRLICQFQSAAGVDLPGSDAAHTELLERAVANGHAASSISSPRADAAGSQPSRFTRLVCPVFEEARPCALVELVEFRTSNAHRERASRQLAEAMCELAGDFHRRLRIRELSRWKTNREWIEEFTHAIHGSLDLTSVAYAIANEGRRLSGWDRVSVLIPHGNRFRLVAMSGVDAPDRRSSLVQSIERFARLALAAGGPFHYDGDSHELPPQLEAALQTFLDDSLARRVAAMALTARPPSERELRQIGAVVFERFAAAGDDSACVQRAELIAYHAAPALRNALDHRDLPFFALLSRIQRIAWVTRLRRLPFVLTAAIGVLLIAAAMILAPARFSVEASGELQPEIRREVFAPYDGVIQKVHVDHGSRVESGQPLVEMRQSQLDLDFTRVLGELQTAKKQLDSIQATRLQRNRSNDENRPSDEQLTSEEEEVKKLIEGLEQQRAILLAQKSELRVLSPIRGQVLTWEVRRALESRPVQRGQILMTVADPDGPWILELHVADSDVGHLLEASQNAKAGLPVRFLLATQTGTSHRGEVTRIAMSPRVDEDRRATVLVTVRVLNPSLGQPRPGASVVAKVECGKRALGFVWFHDLIEAVQKHLLF